MNIQTQLQFRHSLRPLNVFSFCAQPIAAPRAEYVRATRDLPPCPDCVQAYPAKRRNLASNSAP
jgi:hypothetical protein